MYVVIWWYRQAVEIFHYNARRMYSKHSSEDKTFTKNRSIQRKQHNDPASQGPKPPLYNNSNTAVGVHAVQYSIYIFEVCWYNMYGLYVCVYGQNFQQSMNQPGIVANPTRGQLKRETETFRCPRSPLRIWSREMRDEFGRPVPRQHAHSSLHSG